MSLPCMMQTQLNYYHDEKMWMDSLLYNNIDDR